MSGAQVRVTLAVQTDDQEEAARVAERLGRIAVGYALEGTTALVMTELVAVEA